MIPHLLRHGDTGHGGFRGRLDDPLTDLGWQQMEQAVTLWRGNRIVCSPRQRCQHFAENLAARLQVPLTVDERFSELDFGCWEGHTAAELIQKDPQTLAAFWRDPWQQPPPEGETLEHFCQRVEAGWIESMQQYAGQTVLLVTHGGVIRLLHHRLNRTRRSDFLTYPVPHGSLHAVNDWKKNESPSA
ncbi:histidine phosphatase family protein [Ferrovum sp.]|uniref:histidine phosphatase family protein n=1 Tax=Ferrovum sp. TaxID=2609467 RepID=UPI002617C220|nr:histidine phosphatase family protein [Ferrovum sp.]